MAQLGSTNVYGDLSVTGSINGTLNGNASSATYATSAGSASSATTASSATYANSAGGADYATSAGSCTGNAATVSRASFGDSSNCEHNANNMASNGMWYYTSNGPSDLGESTTDGAIYSQAYSSNWVGQIAQDYRNGNIFVRGKNNGTWSSWKKVNAAYADSAGSAGSVTWSNVSGKPSFATVATSGAYGDLSGTPSSLPASDVSEWAKASSKPSYTASEVGAATSGHSHTLYITDGTNSGTSKSVSTSSVGLPLPSNIKATSFKTGSNWTQSVDSSGSLVFTYG